MLTESKLIKNGDIFLQKSEEFKIFNDCFIEKFSPKILLAPSSINMYGAYKGGLVESVLKLTANVININKGLNEIFDSSKLIKLSFRFSIGKSILFVEEDEDWKIKKGMYYKYADLGVPFTVPELSLQMLNECGIELTKDEFSDILCFSKQQDKSVETFASNEFNLVNFAYKLTSNQMKNISINK